MTTPNSDVKVRSPFERWSALGGAAFVVLAVVGSIVMFSGTPDSSSAPDKIIKYYSDGGHRDKIALGWAIVCLGVFFFLFFVTALRQRMRRYDPDGGLSTLAVIGGSIYAAATAIAFSLETAVDTMSDDTYQNEVFPELIHAASDAAYVIHAGAGAIGIAAMIIAASVVALRARRVPSWLAWLSIVVGIASLFLIVFVPIFIMLAWVLVVSVAMFIREPQGAPAP